MLDFHNILQFETMAEHGLCIAVSRAGTNMMTETTQHLVAPPLIIKSRIVPEEKKGIP